MVKRRLVVLTILLLSVAYAQNIVTASAYFKAISDYYASLKDYEVTMDILVGKTLMTGRASFKRPNLLRIDFSKPQNQVIAFNGDMLTVYLPRSGAILEQALNPQSSGVKMGTPQGLALMTRYYAVSYKSGQSPVSLDNNSDEQVVKFVLTRRATSESFRNIEIAVTPATKLIRRITAITGKGESFVFDFFDYSLNVGLSDQRFIYDAPSSANNFNNFLYGE